LRQIRDKRAKYGASRCGICQQSIALTAQAGHNMVAGGVKAGMGYGVNKDTLRGGTGQRSEYLEDGEASSWEVDAERDVIATVCIGGQTHRTPTEAVP
jgi:hypothetical protein